MNRENIIFLCEGKFERALINVLIDNDLLIYSREDLYSGDVINGKRNFVKFQEDELEGLSVSDKFKIYKIQDDIPKNMRGKEMVPQKHFQSMIESVTLVLTRPEIEMIMVIYNDLELEYQNYITRSRGRNTPKPSSFLKSYDRKFSNCKHYDFVYSHFTDMEKLKLALRKYRDSHKHRQAVREHPEILSIFDLLNSC